VPDWDEPQFVDEYRTQKKRKKAARRGGQMREPKKPGHYWVRRHGVTVWDVAYRPESSEYWYGIGSSVGERWRELRVVEAIGPWPDPAKVMVAVLGARRALKDAEEAMEKLTALKCFSR
jgi:hypothetical protein